MASSGSLECEHSLNGTLQEPTSLSGELSLPITNEGNTTDYNALYNKPTINGTELKGDLTLEELGIIVNTIKDILINGATIVDKDGNANIPIMTHEKMGVAKYWNAYGIQANDEGYLQMLKADNSNIDKRDSNYRAIVPTNLDYALKQAMCDGKGAEWTQEEKAMARMRLGDEWRYIGKVETQEDVAKMTMGLDENGQPFNLRKAYIKVVNYPNASDLTTQVRLTFNNMNESIFHDSKMITGVTSSETAMMCEVIVEKINNRIFPVSIYSSYNKTNIPYTLSPSSTSNSINYRPLLGEIDGYINQIYLYSWQNVIGSGAYMEVWGVDA